MSNKTNLLEKKLFESFLYLENVKEIENYCRDLMTEAEIRELAGRLEVAKNLDAGNSQRNVSEKTGVSIATVTRVNKALLGKEKGYKLLIDRLKAVSK